jgi:hypothetical protein
LEFCRAKQLAGCWKKLLRTLDDFFATQLGARQQRGIEAACVDMWKPYRLSIEQWAPNCRIRSHTG